MALVDICALQVPVGAQVEMVYLSAPQHHTSLEREHALLGQGFSKGIAAQEEGFVQRFDQRFGISDRLVERLLSDSLVGAGTSKKKLRSGLRKMGMAGLSNMIGGTGYFYGKSLVQSKGRSLA